jgi:uncharacterized membrane-anchored protein YitT (DUF2179 family)
MTQSLGHSPLEDAFGLVTGVVLAAMGVHILGSAGLVTGGTAGLALLLSGNGVMPFAVVFAVINAPFFVLAWRRRGVRFTLTSLGCVLATSALTSRLSVLVGELHPEPAFAFVVGNMLAGVGILILFRHGASLGGFNVVALLVQDRFGVRAGWVLLCFDAAVVLLSVVVAPPSTVLLSALGAAVLNVTIAVNHRADRYVVPVGSPSK